jgi:hypothetical protein
MYIFVNSFVILYTYVLQWFIEKKKIYETAKLIKNLILRCHFSVKSRHLTLILEAMKTGFGINYY